MMGITTVLAQVEPIDTPEIVWSLLWPLLILGLGGILLVTITSLIPATREKSFPALFTALLGVASIASLGSIHGKLPILVAQDGSEVRGSILVVGDAMVVDSFTVFVTMVISLSVIFAALLLDDYLRREGLDGPEWYVLMLMSAVGGIILASANDLIVTFMGLEVLSIAVYVLAALHLRRSTSQEAGFKYFVLGALSSAIFLYGIALVYGATGSTRIDAIGASLGTANADGLRPDQESSMILVGIALLLIGFGFKVSAAPFHVWTPDVYEGSPTPVVAFMASAVKVAGFAGLVRVFLFAFGDLSEDWRALVGGMAMLTLLVGALLAIVQTNIKRMMAYSSITHAGFMLVGFHAAAGPDPSASLAGSRSVLFYMLAYSIMVIGTFAVITVMGRQGDGRHAIDSYKGLARRQPVLAAAFAILLFAQSGVPFTSGFFAKFRVIAAAAQGEGYLLAAVAMVAAVIGVYLYLRVVVAMFLDDGALDDGALDDGALDDGALDDGALDERASDDVAAADGSSGGTATAHALEHDVDIDASNAADDGPIDVPPAALVVVVVCAALTVFLGVLPDVGSGFLTDAAQALTLLRP